MFYINSSTYKLSISMDMTVEIQVTRLLTQNFSRIVTALDISCESVGLCSITPFNLMRKGTSKFTV